MDQVAAERCRWRKRRCGRIDQSGWLRDGSLEAAEGAREVAALVGCAIEGMEASTARLEGAVGWTIDRANKDCGRLGRHAAPTNGKDTVNEMQRCMGVPFADPASSRLGNDECSWFRDEAVEQ